MSHKEKRPCSPFRSKIPSKREGLAASNCDKDVAIAMAEEQCDADGPSQLTAFLPQKVNKARKEGKKKSKEAGTNYSNSCR